MKIFYEKIIIKPLTFQVLLDIIFALLFMIGLTLLLFGFIFTISVASPIDNFNAGYVHKIAIGKITYLYLTDFEYSIYNFTTRWSMITFFGGGLYFYIKSRLISVNKNQQ